MLYTKVPVIILHVDLGSFCEEFVSSPRVNVSFPPSPKNLQVRSRPHMQKEICEICLVK